jgi:hypothetical protein
MVLSKKSISVLRSLKTNKMRTGDLKAVEMNILGKTFPLKVTLEEAAWIQELENEINQKISGYQTSFPGQDKMDCIIMTLLTYAFENKHQSSPPTSVEDDKVEQKLDDLLQMLSVH